MRSASAMAVTPALRAQGFARALPISAAAYAKAAEWAALWTFSTAAAFKNVLNVDQQTADAVFAQLQSDGVLDAADAGGIAKAVTPWFKEAETAARLAKVSRAGADMSGKASDVLDKVSEGASDVPRAEFSSSEQVSEPDSASPAGKSSEQSSDTASEQQSEPCVGEDACGGNLEPRSTAGSDRSDTLPTEFSDLDATLRADKEA